MAAVATESRRLAGMHSVTSMGTVVLSGSYTTGGDALAIPKPGTTKNAHYVEFNSKNGNYYQWDGAAQKMKTFSAPGTELGAGAYAAGYTGDVINYRAEWPKFG